MYAAICLDRPNSAALRDANRAAHMAHLEANADKLAFAGPLRTEDNSASNGAILVIDVATREEAEAFMAGDAFNTGGVYESVIIRPFKKVFPVE